jgi:hypothetical protein
MAKLGFGVKKGSDIIINSIEEQVSPAHKIILPIL